MGDQPILPGFRFENAQVSNCQIIQILKFLNENLLNCWNDLIFLLHIFVAGKRFSFKSTIHGDKWF